jgi:hypothetical protein
MPSVYEFRFYSGAFDGEGVRLSLFNQHGHEFWRIIPAGEGLEYRERRDDALRAIWRAICDGSEPGEVNG